jgi:hypothetical protein
MRKESLEIFLDNFSVLSDPRSSRNRLYSGGDLTGNIV